MRAIKILIGGKEYTFGFKNRDSIRRAERLGVNVFKSKDNIFTQSDTLFYSALLDNHPDMKREEADELINKLVEEGSVSYDELSAKLLDLFTAFYLAPKTGKNVKKQTLTIVEI